MMFFYITALSSELSAVIIVVVLALFAFLSLVAYFWFNKMVCFGEGQCLNKYARGSRRSNRSSLSEEDKIGDKSALPLSPSNDEKCKSNSAKPSNDAT